MSSLVHSPATDPGDMAIVAAFHSPIEASAARDRLEDAGILVRLVDEEMSLTYGGYLDFAIGGIKVAVRADQAEQARSLLGTARGAAGESAKRPATKEKWVHRALVAAILFGMFPPFCLLAPVFLVAARRAPGAWTRSLRLRAVASMLISAALLAGSAFLILHGT